MRRSFVLSIVLVACTTSFPDETPLVSGPRLLAVQTIPAEVAPGAAFTLAPLYVGPTGPADPSAIDWATCLLQKPLGVPGPINPACFVDTSSDLVALGTGGTVTATMPSNACEIFGPDSPPPKPGQPAARPTDPDTTGGFYLPVRVKAEDPEWTAALQRIACQPNGVSSAVYTAFSNGYRPNANPVVASVVQMNTSGASTPIALATGSSAATATISVSGGAKVSLQVAWSACGDDPSAAATCGGAESYLAIDPISKTITTRRESMVASWYASAGSFDTARVGRDETDLTTSVTDGWSAPTTPGTVLFWVVLRDSRGGAGWASFALDIDH